MVPVRHFPANLIVFVLDASKPFDQVIGKDRPPFPGTLILYPEAMGVNIQRLVGDISDMVEVGEEGRQQVECLGNSFVRGQIFHLIDGTIQTGLPASELIDIP